VPPVDRKNPVRAKSSESSFSLMEFIRVFPDDDACLRWLWDTKYAAGAPDKAHCPRCDKVRTFRHYANKTRTRQVWTCTSCSFQISPTAGTIFHKSSTSLHLWFYAIWIMTSTRCGVSAKQLERELGVTYKTAWRMFNKIRNELMEQDDTPLNGPVEADETFMGGKPRLSERRAAMAQGRAPKNYWMKPRPIVFGAVERGGRVKATVIPNSQAATVQGQIREYVMPRSLVYTDDWRGYLSLHKRGYEHRKINHTARVYVQGDVHTQTIDGFFAMLKNAIRGVHHGVSEKWLQGYLNEYAWRYNHRDDRRAMFLTLLFRAAASYRLFGRARSPGCRSEGSARRAGGRIGGTHAVDSLHGDGDGARYLSELLTFSRFARNSDRSGG
jgi:transposase